MSDHIRVERVDSPQMNTITGFVDNVNDTRRNDFGDEFVVRNVLVTIVCNACARTINIVEHAAPVAVPLCEFSIDPFRILPYNSQPLFSTIDESRFY
jgi:hypothetical protein